MPELEAAAGAPVTARVANNPNAYDDIVEELDGGTYTEIILETPPAHLSHWLHVDLPRRVSELGLPTEAVAVSVKNPPLPSPALLAQHLLQGAAGHRRSGW